MPVSGLARRAGVRLAKFLVGDSSTPTPETGAALIYSKLVNGVAQLFAENSAGVETQLSGSTVIPSGAVITPASIGSTQNNYNPTGLAGARLIRQDISSSVTITGLVAQPENTLLTITNIRSTGSMAWITLSHESGSSTAANRFHLPSRAAWYIPPGGSITLRYDAGLSRWMMWGLAANNFPTENSDGGPGLSIGNPAENIGLARVSSLTIGVMAGAANRFRVSGNSADPNPVSYQSDSYFNALGQFRWAANQNIAVTGTVNNQALTSSTITARLTPTGATVITGFAGGAAGRLITLVNLGADTITLNSEDAGSSAANRILLPAATFDILADAACQLWYDTTSSRWRKLS